MAAKDWTLGSATFDESRRFRYHLWRGKPDDLLGGKRRTLCACMHNPSSAGAKPTDNDPTVRKLIGFCDRWGFMETMDADLVLVAWGALKNKWARARAAEVLKLIGRPVYCIGLTRAGQPLHPLMACYTDAPIVYASSP